MMTIRDRFNVENLIVFHDFYCKIDEDSFNKAYNVIINLFIDDQISLEEYKILYNGIVYLINLAPDEKERMRNGCRGKNDEY